MAPSVQVVLSGTVTFGVPLLYAVHELIVLRRWRGDGGGDPPPAPTPPRPRTEPDRPKLPDCLIPNLPPLPADGRPSRAKVLEPA